ncbi:hypothetical protein OHC33_004631 [Knufia fluminis]|uniref:Uncharacterized protein n=1 Tax=Knufia fluminis TaxID=191047 RepID=A0AAN8EQY1_9EURO|nr:hypothetical protein OHC33_004631 [Knufia fluminis]
MDFNMDFNMDMANSPETRGEKRKYVFDEDATLQLSKRVVLKYNKDGAPVAASGTPAEDATSSSSVFVTLKYNKVDPRNRTSLPTSTRHNSPPSRDQIEQLADPVDIRPAPIKRAVPLKLTFGKQRQFKDSSQAASQRSKSVLPPAIYGKSANNKVKLRFGWLSNAPSIHKDRQAPSATLGDLPAEILEMIAWKGLNPSLPLVCRSVFQKLGHMKDLRFDMTMLIFCDWVPVRSDLQEMKDSSGNVLDRTTLLPFRSSIAKRVTPFCDFVQRAAIQRQLGEAAWCTIAYLRQAAQKVVTTVLTHGWSESDFSGQDKEKYLQILNSPGDHFTHRAYRAGFETADGLHEFTCYSVYEISIECTQTDQEGACAGTVGCLGDRMVSGPVFELPPVPDRILRAANNEDKKAAMRFYQSQGDPRNVSIHPDWTAKQFYHLGARDAIFSAVRDGHGDLLQMALNETCNGLCCQKVHWKVSGQHLLLLLAACGHFESAAGLKNSFDRSCHYQMLLDKNGRYAGKRVANDWDFEDGVTEGPALAEGPLKACVLTLADEAAYARDDHTAMKLLEWWTSNEKGCKLGRKHGVSYCTRPKWHEPGYAAEDDSASDSDSDDGFDVMAEPLSEADQVKEDWRTTNQHALEQANENVGIRVRRLERLSQELKTLKNKKPRGTGRQRLRRAALTGSTGLDEMSPELEEYLARRQEAVLRSSNEQ